MFISVFLIALLTPVNAFASQTDDNMEVIDKIREQYDPLANLVRPHITIVFPFDSDRSNEEL